LISAAFAGLPAVTSRNNENAVATVAASLDFHGAGKD
jgi:hypothetical protein